MALINFWLDTTLLLNVVFIGWITATLRVVFPAPTTAAGWTLWGRTFDQWSSAQFWSLCSLGLLVLIHVMLHWNWVCSIVAAQVLRIRNRPDDGMQTIYGVGLLIVLLNLIGGGVIVAILTVHRPQ